MMRIYESHAWTHDLVKDVSWPRTMEDHDSRKAFRRLPYTCAVLAIDLFEWQVLSNAMLIQHFGGV